MTRTPAMARRLFRLAEMLGEGTIDQALCLLETGNLEASLGRSAKAEECYRRALAQDPALTVAARNLAMLFLSMRREKESLELMKKISIEAPESEEARELSPLIRQLEKNLQTGG